MSEEKELVKENDSIEESPMKEDESVKAESLSDNKEIEPEENKVEEASLKADNEDTKENKEEIKLSGLIGTKIGMTQTISDDGKVIPTTVIKLGPCLALEKKVKNHKTSLKIGYEDAKPRLLTKSKLGYLSKLKVKPIKYVKEFDLLNPDIEIKPGQEIKANIFKEGDIADVTSKSKGRGFAGVIKRHNFAGLRHTHGTPQNQRSGGSIGACAYPGRVWKGQKMAGRYGGKKSTIQGLKVLGIDLEDNLILIKGSVPGSNGSVVYVNHTRKG